MKNTWIRLLWILAGLLLVVVGFIIMLNPVSTIISLSILLGLFMIASGVADLFAYSSIKGLMPGSGWVLIDGIFTLLMGVLLLFNSALGAASINLFFTIWMLFVGVSRIINSLDYRKLGSSTWLVHFVVGAILLILGIISLFVPATAAATLSFIIGFALVIRGIMAVVNGIVSGSYFN